MAEEIKPAAPPFVLNSQYIRDLSFEVPKAPLIFAMLQEKQPEIKISVDVQVQNLHENLFEVVLKTETNCSLGDQVAFIMEIAYAGLFIMNVPKEQLHHTLLVDCPTLLFPFVRYLMADLTREGGFLPVMMGLVDFENMYKNQTQGQTQAGPTATETKLT